MKLKKRYILLPFLILFFVYMMFSIHREVRRRTIADFNAQQMILAKQAARGIETFFRDIFLEITYLARIDDVVQATLSGRNLLSTYYQINSSRIKAVTLTSAEGRIVYTEPHNPGAIGADISGQAHVQEVIKTHQPVVSDVFLAVQGYQAVAYHIPITRNSEYLGSLAVLIPFYGLTNEYLENIRIGKSGHAWVISQNEVELYCQEPDHVGKSVAETSREHPDISGMAGRMRLGSEGAAQYRYRHKSGGIDELRWKHAVFHPIHLGNTFWSVAVTTPEDEILSTMEGFRNKLLLIAGLLTCTAAFFFYSGIRSWNIVREEKQREKAAAALRESEYFFSQMFEQSTTSTCLLNPSGTIIRVNPAFCRLFGVEEKRITDGRYQIKRDRVLIDTPTILLLDEIFKQKRTRSWETVYDFDLIPQSASMEIRSTRIGKIHLEVFGFPILDDENELQYVVLQHYDVTEKKKTQELLIQNEKMMSIGGLAAGMAHELNNPLGGMMQGIQNVQRRLSPDLAANFEAARESDIDLHNLKHYLEKRKINSNFEGILQSGKRASQIISNMLLFSRKGESRQIRKDVAELIENALELAGKDYDLENKFDFRRIKIKKEYGDETLEILCIENEIEQVLLNLLSNAAWAMARENSNMSPQITIRLSREEAMARIDVADNGPGMDASTTKRIFEPFFTTKPVGQGTGLGLSVSYMIVTNNHNGKMRVESEPGKGALFTIHLPLG